MSELAQPITDTARLEWAMRNPRGLLELTLWHGCQPELLRTLMDKEIQKLKPTTDGHR